MEKTDMQFNEFKFVGSVTFYVALFSDELATIVKYESEFRKPITEEFIQDLVKEFIKYYDKEHGMKVTSVQFVSKEVYEAYCEAYHSYKDVEISWRDDKCFINGKEVKA